MGKNRSDWAAIGGENQPGAACRQGLNPSQDVCVLSIPIARKHERFSILTSDERKPVIAMRGKGPPAINCALTRYA